jgi:hypothetical protein
LYLSVTRIFKEKTFLPLVIHVTQWPKKMVQNEKQRSTKHAYEAKVRVTRIPLKAGVNSCAQEVSADPAQLVRKLLKQEFLLVKLKSSLRKCYGCHHDVVDRYGISVSQMITDMFHLHNGQKKKYKRTNNDRQNIHTKLKIE